MLLLPGQCSEKDAGITDRRLSLAGIYMGPGHLNSSLHSFMAIDSALSRPPSHNLVLMGLPSEPLKSCLGFPELSLLFLT